MILPTATKGDRGAGEALAASEKVEEAIYTCKYPGCTRQYASTDGVRKHCRKSHADWLRKVDEEKAANGGARWAAYCTREAIVEGGVDPRTTPVGSKRAREIMAAGGLVPTGGGGGSLDNGFIIGGQQSHQSRHGYGIAMDGKSILRPPVPPHRSSSSENNLPPELVSVPNDLSTPLPAASTLTPNAQARQRLGEIADDESSRLNSLSHYDTGGALQPAGFFAWSMPPLKRGLSLSDTREAAAVTMMHPQPEATTPHDEYHDSPSFLDSVLA